MEQSRALVGDSLAVTLALITAVKYPHTFSKVIMQSPYVDEDVLSTVKNAKNIHGIDIYHTIGENETAVDTTDGSEVDFEIGRASCRERVWIWVVEGAWKERWVVERGEEGTG